MGSPKGEVTNRFTAVLAKSISALTETPAVMRGWGTFAKRQQTRCFKETWVYQRTIKQFTRVDGKLVAKETAHKAREAEYEQRKALQRDFILLSFKPK